MKKFFLHSRLIFLFCVLQMFVGCRKRHDAVAPPVSFKASFIIYEPLYGTAAAYPTDTIINYQAAFKAEEGYSSYRWKVGNDTTVFRKSSFLLRFPLEVSGLTIPVQLIASKGGQTDTVEKSFSIYALKGTPTAISTPYSVNLAYLGRFEGSYEDAPTHRFTIAIANLDTAITAGGFRGFRILNLPEGCGGKYTRGQTCMVNTISPAFYSYAFECSYRTFFVSKVEKT